MQIGDNLPGNNSVYCSDQQLCLCLSPTLSLSNYLSLTLFNSLSLSLSLSNSLLSNSLLSSSLFSNSLLSNSLLSNSLEIIIYTECLQYLPELPQQRDEQKNKTKHGKLKLTKSFLVLASNLKKQHIEIQYVPNRLVKLDSPNCFAIFGSSACQGQHVFSMSFLTFTVPWSPSTNVQELI